MNTNNANNAAAPGAVLDAGRVLQFVQLSSVFAKRALDEREAHQTAEKQAAAVAPETLKALLASGAIAEHQKEAAAKLLNSHAGTLTLLKNAALKLGETGKTAAHKQASELGHAEADPGSGSGGQRATTKVASSLTDPFVGQRAGNGVVRESDARFFAGLGLAVPGAV